MFNRLFLVRVLIAIGLLAGVLISLPLWLTRTNYPRLPLLNFIPELPHPFDACLLLISAAALVWAVWRPGDNRIAMILFAAVIVLVLQDQSRLQPWFVEYGLIFLAITIPQKSTKALNATRLVIAAIYFWSGVHKMNTYFAGTVFRLLISPLRDASIAVTIQPLGRIVPFIEMAMGVCLLIPKTRRLAVIAIIAMHALLLSILGPWALNWNRVVWPWNLVMMLLVPCLFWKTDVPFQELLLPRRDWLSIVLFVFVVVLPAFSLVGLWDANPSFALYSGDSLTGSVVMNTAMWDRADGSIKQLAINNGTGYRVQFGDWSEHTVHVPAYPAERTLRQLALSFCASRGVDGGFFFILEKPADWLYRPGWQTVINSDELCR